MLYYLIESSNVDITVAINGNELVLPGFEYNPLIFQRMTYENDRYRLLRNSLGFIKIE